MYQIVLDTNVLVAALRSRRGASYLLLDNFDAKRWTPNLTVALLLEYEAVLKRETAVFGLTEEDIDNLLDAICSRAKLNRQYFIWRPTANDPNDDLVLEAAIAGNCDFIITYNKRDFGSCAQFGIQCLTPKEFLILIGVLQ